MPTAKRQKWITELISDLRAGKRVTDFRFDGIFPAGIRELSETHWSPVDVSARAAAILSSGPETKILDIGSGCGKFCLVGAVTTTSHFFGIEQRLTLYETAKLARAQLNIPRAAFVHGNMMHVDWSLFDCFYLFNPFDEHRVERVRIDNTLEYRPETYQTYVNAVRQKLEALKAGTRVVTYHGFGGEFPQGYQRVVKEAAGTDFLELWEKRLRPVHRSSIREPAVFHRQPRHQNQEQE